MIKNIREYIDLVRKLPLKNKYTKEELLINDFLIESKNNIEIYYAPHNEYINYKAKILIVGITPGFQQMNDSIAMARKCIEIDENLESIKYKCKVAGRFSGSLRNNIISMLDEIGLNSIIKIESSSELFKEKDYLLHTISLIPYPVFVNGKNFSGHTPRLIKSDFLMKYVYENFLDEVNKLGDVMIIPLGKAVEEVLIYLKNNGELKGSHIVYGFPHPSGANAHRFSQLRDNKSNMKLIMEEFFNKT